MARDEAFSRRVCGHLRHMSVCEGRASEASMSVTAFEDSRVEMGGDHDGFHSGITSYSAGYNSIWVVVDRLTKVAHFIPVNTTYSGARLAELYISRIVCLHGVPKKIIADRGSQFTSQFWEQLHDSLDTKLHFSTAYHPQIDGQTERTNQVLEDMLRACAI